MFYAIGIGIICDLFSTSLLGMYAVAFLLSTIFLQLFRNVFSTLTFSIFLIYVNFTTMIQIIIVSIITSFMFDFYSGYKYFVTIGLLEVIVNSLAAFPIFIIFKAIFGIVDKLKSKLQMSW